MPAEGELQLSVIIPSYNSAPWLPSTIGHLFAALDNSKIRAEILVIDDGSTDQTVSCLAELSARDSRLRYFTQANQGVFATCREGAAAAKAATLLVVNSRLLVDPLTFNYLEPFLSDSITETRIGHVRTDASVPLVGRFWEVLTHVFWGSYLRDPKLTVLTPEVFDRVPKGTGFLVVDRDRFLRAYQAMNLELGRFISDDTRLLRLITEERPIILDPGFGATYRPRVSFKKFLSHAFLRGTLFVDSYYATNLPRTLTLWAIVLGLPLASALLMTSALLGQIWVVATILGLALAILAALLSIAVINRAPRRAVAGFLIYLLPFVGAFWAGLVRGFWVRFSARSAPDS